MPSTLQDVLGFLQGLPAPLVYLVLGAGAALENVVPPVPADTFVLLGGFMAALGAVNVWVLWGVTWLFNVGSALLVYGIGHRYGRRFFEVGLGRYVLNREQLRRMGFFYDRFGPFAVFVTRFLPGLRAAVPAFAGVSHQPFLPVALPVGLASAIWYGALVWLGATAGRNVETVLGWVDHVNVVLLALALGLILLIAWWWARTRRASAP